MAFAPGGELKIWADGLDIRLTAKMGFGDVAEKRGHGAQIEMDGAAYSIVPVLGQGKVNSRYDLLTYRYTDPVIDILQENGRLDISVYDRKLNSEDVYKRQGVQSPTPEWGAMISDARNFLRANGELALYPGLCIMITVLGFNLIGDGLRDALDPKLKN